MAGKPTLTPIELEVAKFARSKGIGPQTIGGWFGVSRTCIMYHTTPGYKEKMEARILRYRRKLERSFARNQRYEHRRKHTATR